MGDPRARVHLRGATAGRLDDPIGQRLRGVPGSVPAAAVGHDDLDGVTAKILQWKQRLRDRFSFVEDRDDDRDHWVRAGDKPPVPD